jgi:hypothetical protein
MRSRLCAALGVLVPLLVAAVSFHHLAAQPDAQLVDGGRASLDHAGKPDARGVGNDLTFFMLPRYYAAVGHLRETGRIPLWDDSGFGGRPLLGNPQAGLFYAPVWLAWWSSRPSALGWLTVAHLVWAGVGTFVLARALGVSRWAAAVAAGCFEASPYLIAHTFEGHYPHVWSVSWYPWAFLAFLLARRRAPAGVLLLPCVLAMAFLTGHPQEWYYLVLALGGWAVADAFLETWAGRLRAAVGGLLVWSGLLVVSLGLCALEIAPEIAVQPWLLKGSAIPIGRINHYYLHSINLLQLLSPFALGRPHDYFGHDNYWETVCSAGLVPLVLAVVGLSRHPNRLARRGFLGLLVVAIVMACGRKMGLFTLAFRFLPGMNRFRVPSRTLFLASLAVAVLAGLGIDYLARLDSTSVEWARFRRTLRGLALFLAMGLASCATIARLLPETAGRTARPMAGRDVSGRESQQQSLVERRAQRAVSQIGNDRLLWVLTVGLFVSVSWTGLAQVSPKRTAIGLGTLALIELGLLSQSLLTCTPLGQLVRSGQATASIGDAPRASSGPLRIAASPLAFPDLEAALGGFEKTNVNDIFQIQHAADLYERLYAYLDEAPLEAPPREQPMDREADRFHARVARTVLDRMSVGHVITSRPSKIGGLESVEQPRACVRAIHLERNPRALPRAYVVPRAEARRERRVPPAVILDRIDAREAVVMPSDPLPRGPRQPFKPATWLPGAPDQVSIRVTTEAPGLLVVGNAWMPGWRAWVDGREEPVSRGDFWLQVVPLRTASEHRIELRYIPPRFLLGVAISAATALACVVVALAFVRGRLHYPAGTIDPTTDSSRIRPSRAVYGATIPSSAAL